MLQRVHDHRQYSGIVRGFGCHSGFFESYKYRRRVGNPSLRLQGFRAQWAGPSDGCLQARTKAVRAAHRHDPSLLGLVAPPTATRYARQVRIFPNSSQDREQESIFLLDYKPKTARFLPAFNILFIRFRFFTNTEMSTFTIKQQSHKAGHVPGHNLKCWSSIAGNQGGLTPQAQATG